MLGNKNQEKTFEKLDTKPRTTKIATVKWWNYAWHRKTTTAGAGEVSQNFAYKLRRI